MINTANIGSFGKTKAYLFADFSELLVLAQEYEELSRSNLADLLNGEIVEEDDEGHEITDETNDFIITRTGSDRISGYVQDCFDHFDYRKAALKNCYPYELSNDLLSLKPDRTSEQLLYFFLLCCSQLGRFNANDGIRQRCAATFTKLCAEALKSLLSPSAEVYVFDANSDHRRTIFGTDARKALIKLICNDEI